MWHASGCFVAVVLAASLAVRSFAQTPVIGPRSPERTDAIERAVGLQAEAGELWGAGPGYKVRFGERGIEFTPALGARAPHNLPLTFELQAVGRGDALEPVAAPTRRMDGTTVRYERDRCTEVYTLRQDGLKQSFVFAELPAGEGDLRVRGSLRSELVPRVTAVDALACQLLDVGGVLLQGVVGIDARGRRAAGSLRLDGDSVEFVLPAAFVAAAALPLELDPLLGSLMPVALTGDDRTADVAYDSTTDRYLVVWQRRFSATDTDIRGLRFDASGNPFGSLIIIEGNVATPATQPKVASVNSRDGFVVVWEQQGSIVARGVTADTATLTSTILVAGGPGYGTPDVAGEASLVDQEAICVFGDVSGRVWATRLYYSSPTTLAFASTRLLSIGQGFIDRHPAIAKSGGADGRFLVVWERVLLSINQSQLICQVMTRQLGILGQLTLASFGVVITHPDVDGDGSRWVLAYELLEGNGVDHDILAGAVQFEPANSTLSWPTNGGIFVARTLANDQHLPSVCWLGDSCLVSYAYEDGAGYGCEVRSIDPYLCAVCEGNFALETGPADADAVAMASKLSGGGHSNDAAIVWQSVLGATSSNLWLQRFQARDGVVTDLAGGCGGGGVAKASCAHQGHGGFRVQLHEARAAAPTLLVLGFQIRGLACGSCMLLPDPFTGVVVATGNTTVLGGISMALAIPNSPGVVGNALLAQWVVGGGNNCFSGFDLSNAIRVTIE